MHPNPTPARFARAALAAAALALVAATPARAETGLGTGLKNTAIAGTIATWTVAALKGAPIFSCLGAGQRGNDGWGGRVAGGKDAELSYVSVGIERHECPLTEVGPFTLDLSPVLSAGSWQAKSDSRYHHDAVDLAFVPMLHWRYPVSQGARLDLEFGIGPAFLSQPSIGNRLKSTEFQFSDHFGIGISSADGHWRAGFAFRHVSNLSIKTPNDAVDFKGIALEWTP